MRSLLAKNRLLILFLVLSIVELMAQPRPAKLRRVCRPGTSNFIYFFPSDDTCSRFQKYYVWARNGTIGPYQIIDSIDNKLAEQYIHINANPTGTPTNWSYFIAYTDSCQTSSSYSDTLSVDETPPDTLFLDSVSVDILTNKVQIGWRKNPSPDFYRYILYYDSLGIKWVEVTNIVLRDTFITDNNTFSNPRLRSIKYDITSKDSCDTRAQVFNINPHSTIYLTGSSDTCKKEASFSWTHYIGWPAIKQYYIFKQTNGSGFILLDSVAGNINSYKTPIILGDVNDFFVRAIKDTGILVSSSSSLLTLQTRGRKDPINTQLNNITVINPDEDKIESSFIIQPQEEARFVNIKYSENGNPYVTLTTQNVLLQTGEQKAPFISPNRNSVIYYKLESADLCNQIAENNGIIPQLVLTIVDQGSSNLVSWNKHFGWANGVEKYYIYRGTDDDLGNRVYSLIDSVPSSDSVYTDNNLPDKIGSFGLCYYVEAKQNVGAPNGFTNIARSFSRCYVGKLVSFIPNAFRPNGVNQTFRPEGSYIDYAESSMEIFDRWGGRIVAIKDISKGWNGNDASGNPCSAGVYYYKINLQSPNGEKQTKTGFVTLLN